MGALQKILGLGLAGLLIACLAVGSAWAYFADTESASDNQVSAGTLDLNTNDANGVTQSLICSNLKPGRTVAATTVNLKNIGSRAASSVDISLNYNTDDSADASPNTTPMSTNDLAAVMEITALNYDYRTILTLLSDNVVDGGNGNGYIDVQDMKNEASRLTGRPGLNPGQIKPFDITVQMRSGSSNNFCGDGINITMTFVLNQ